VSGANCHMRVYLIMSQPCLVTESKSLVPTRHTIGSGSLFCCILGWVGFFLDSGESFGPHLTRRTVGSNFLGQVGFIGSAAMMV
jgi:hypothetical protein